MRWLAGCCLLLLQAEPMSAPASLPRVEDPELRRAIVLVQEGDYPGGIRAIDAALERLGPGARRRNDRAIAHLYAGVALVAQGKTSAARSRFRQALVETPALTVSAEEFPPKVTQLFRAARADRQAIAPVRAGLRLIQSTSGASGAMRGSSFEVQDPRSVFRVPDDRQAVVSFEWEAPPADYRLHGSWRDPQGRLLLQPDVEVENKGPRVAAYWILELSASIAPGQWTLEVTQDGRNVGRHAIQVLTLPARQREVESDDLYARVRPSLVSIEKRGGDGVPFGRGMGFLVAANRVATAFQVVDGARSLQLRLSDGRTVACDRLAAWDRWQDWALLDVAPTGLPGLRFVDGSLPNDQRYRVVDLDSGDNPYLARPVVALPTSVPGKARERLVLGVAGSMADTGFRLMMAREAVGGPILDARGQVAGIVGGSIVPGEATADGRLGWSATMATPALLITDTPSAPTTLAQLIANGESLDPPVRGDLTRAGLSRDTQESAEGSLPGDEATHFSRSDGRLLVWARFEPRNARKVSLRTRTYDLDGIVKAETDAIRRDFTPGQPQTVSWPLEVAGLPAATYRTDVLVDTQCVWRGYFQLGE